MSNPESKEVISVLRRLIAMNTVSSESTVEIAEYISGYLQKGGFTIEHHKYNLRGVQKVNVVARKGGDNLRLAYAGHMDTVPFDPDEWRSDPLELMKIGDNWFGRGTCDMKGFVALTMVAGSRVPESELVAPFGLVFTSDEEVGCVGAKKLIADKGKVSEMFIIGEPTELEPFTLHKGYMYLVIELKGKNGHSSRPDEALSVIDALQPLLSKIETFKHYLGEITDLRMSPAYPTLNVGVVSTGENSAKNVIADYCQLELDIRPIPGQDVDEVFQAFKHFVTDGESHINGVEVKIGYGRAPTPPMETPSDALIVKEAERMSGHSACSTAFNTEGGVFNSSGADSVICGLGSIQQAHRPNEFVHEDYLTEAIVERYVATIRNICGNPIGGMR